MFDFIMPTIDNLKTEISLTIFVIIGIFLFYILSTLCDKKPKKFEITRSEKESKSVALAGLSDKSQKKYSGHFNAFEMFHKSIKSDSISNSLFIYLNRKKRIDHVKTPHLRRIFNVVRRFYPSELVNIDFETFIDPNRENVETSTEADE